MSHFLCQVWRDAWMVRCEQLQLCPLGPWLGSERGCRAGRGAEPCPEQSWLWVSPCPWDEHTENHQRGHSWIVTRLQSSGMAPNSSPASLGPGQINVQPPLALPCRFCWQMDGHAHKCAQSSPLSMMSFWYFIFRVKFYNGTISFLQAKKSVEQILYSYGKLSLLLCWESDFFFSFNSWKGLLSHTKFWLKYSFTMFCNRIHNGLSLLIIHRKS